MISAFRLSLRVSVLSLLALAGGTAFSIRAQTATGTITGRVANDATGQYLPSAVVSIAGTAQSAVAEAGGTYTLRGVPAGEVKLTASYADLDPVETTVLVAPGQTVTRDFGLTSAAYGDGKGTIKLGQFVVAGEREGNARAIQEQRQSLDQKFVMASDAFGDVNEGNVAEFLKLMPGVMIDYLENDPRAAAIGGLGPQYAAVMMDGAPLASAGSSDIATGRGFQFEQLSISSIETIEMSRTPTPDVSGSAMSGVINMRSKGAFDRKGRFVNWLASLSVNSRTMFRETPGLDDGQSRKVFQNGTLGYSDIFLNNRLGVLAGFNYSLVFGEQKTQDGPYGFNATPGDNAAEIPRLDSIQILDSPKLTQRTNYNLRLDYKLTDELSAWVRGDYNQFKLWTYSRNMIMRFPSAITTDPAVEYSLNSQTSAAANTEFNGSGGAFLKQGFTGTYTTGLNFKRGGFTADLQGTYSLSTNWYDDLKYGYFRTGSNGQLTNLRLTWRRDGPDDPGFQVTQGAGPDWRNPASYTGIVHPNSFSRSGEDQKWTALGNFRYATQGWRVPLVLKWGGSFQQAIRKLIRRSNNLTYTYLGPDGVANTGDERWQVEPVYRLTTTWGTNLTDLPAWDRFALGREHRDHPERFVAPTAAAMLQSRLQGHWDTKEQIDALYVQPLLKLTPTFDLAPGLRWERTRGLAIGPNDIGDAGARRILTGSSTGAVTTSSVDYVQARYGSDMSVPANYDTTLKYLHANYRPRKDIVVRASYNDSITRPPLDQLAGGIQITNESANPPQARVPNPGLVPEMSRSLMLSADYYFPRGAGYVTVTATRRDLKNLIRNTTEDIPFGEDFEGDPQWGGWRLTTTDNVGKAHVSGLEFDFRRKLNFEFMPAALRGLSMFANYTRLYFDNYDNFRRPRQLANGGLMYAWRDLSLGWNVNWVPKFRRAAVPANGWATFDGEKLRQDFRLSYRVHGRVTVFVTGNNIFNQPTKLLYGSDGRFLMRKWSDYGSTWTFGAKGSF